MSEIMIAIAIVCHVGTYSNIEYYQRKCMSEILKCIDGKSLAHDRIAECIKPKEDKK